MRSLGVDRMTANISITLSMKYLRFHSLNTDDGRAQAVAAQTKQLKTNGLNVISPPHMYSKQ